MRLGLLSTANINRAILAGAAKTDRVDVVAVGSRDAARAQAYAAEHGIATAHGSYEALLADPDVDCVLIASPNGATSHEALDRDHAIQEEVRNAARTLLEAVQARKAGKLISPGDELEQPRQK